MLAKSADTFAVDGGKVYLCTEGTTALAKGGSGDMLAGIVSSYVAQGCNALDAAALGSFTLGSTALLAGYKDLNVESLQEMLLTLCHDFCMTLKTPTRLY